MFFDGFFRSELISFLDASDGSTSIGNLTEDFWPWASAYWIESTSSSSSLSYLAASWLKLLVSTKLAPLSPTILLAASLCCSRFVTLYEPMAKVLPPLPPVSPLLDSDSLWNEFAVPEKVTSPSSTPVFTCIGFLLAATCNYFLSNSWLGLLEPDCLAMDF